MAASQKVPQAIHTLTQQLNGIGDWIQELEIRDSVTPQQFDQKAMELRGRQDAAIRELENAVASLQMRGADAAAPSGRLWLVNDKETRPTTLAPRRTTFNPCLIFWTGIISIITENKSREQDFIFMRRVIPK